MLLDPRFIFAGESFTATLDRGEISMNETATMILSLKTEKDEEASSPVIPHVPGLSIFYCETRRILSPQGGKISPSKEFVYTLSPETTGEKIIPSLGVHVGEKLLLSQPLSLNVVLPPRESKDKLSTKAEGGSPPLQPLKDQAAEAPPKAFVRVTVDKPRPFVYEPVKITLWVYATTLFQYQGLKGEPSSKGFTRLKEFKGNFVPHENVETIGGETYYGRNVEEEMWFPTQSGPLNLELGEATLLLKTKAKNLFDRSFQEERPAGHFASHAEPLLLKVDPISLEVRPLPEENKPPDFSGAVGDFTISASMDKTEFQIGDSATLKFQIRGKGNLKQMKDPTFGKFPFATSFEPRASEKVDQGKSSFTVEKTYEIILITSHEGNFTIGPFTLAYFNPTFHKYRKVSTTPILLTIQGKPGGAVTTPAKPPKTEPELLGKDIYYLKKELGPLHSENVPFLKSPIFWGLQCIPLIILFLAFSWRSYQLYLVRNEALFRKRRAFQTSQVHLKKAEHHLSQGRMIEFAREANEAVLGYLSDKTGFSKGALTLDKIGSLIHAGGGDETVQKSVRDCLELLQALQFAAVSRGDRDPKVGYELSKGILRQLERINL